MEQANELTSANLQIKGLEYYCRTDHYGQILKEHGSSDTDLAAAAALILQEAERLGEILGLENFKGLVGVDQGQKVVINEYESDAELVIAAKNSSLRELITTARNL